MFYVRTADRLQRTSTWRENLEGGLDYLKNVILKDSLGLGLSWKSKMQQVVDTYAVRMEGRRHRPEHASASAPSSTATRPTSTLSSSKSVARSVPHALKNAPKPPLKPSHEPTTRGPHHDNATLTWTPVCSVDDILPNTGVCALVEGRHVAVFRVGEDRLLRHRQRGPQVKASVLSRGLVGNLGEHIVVASPLYKNHFNLATGACLEAPEYSVHAHSVSIEDGRVRIPMSYLAPFRIRHQDGRRRRIQAADVHPDTLIRAYMAGAILALAAAFAVTVTVNTGNPLIGALLFPVGFCILYLLGFDLLTGVFTLAPLAVLRQAPRRHLGRRDAQLDAGVLRQLRRRTDRGRVHGHHLHQRLHRGPQRHGPEDRPHRRRVARWAMRPTAPPAC
jgi:nitrite reductase (NADH) small subunit